MDPELGAMARGAEVTRLGAMDLSAEGVGFATDMIKRGN
jgi:hypothetical protein